MKQKYSIVIADVELNVTVEKEEQETVEYVVGVVDRKMRDILLKSKYCPKTQAALLCALDLCADKVKLKQEGEELRDEIEALTDSLKASDEKYSRAQSLTVALEKEKARLEIENMKLRAIIDEAKKNGSISAEDIAAAVTQSDATSERAEAKQEAPEEKKPQNKSRVGNMFDLLTFGDV